MKDWYSGIELAGLGGMPKTISGVVRKAKNDRYIARFKRAQGGGHEYHFDCLPEKTKDHLHKLKMEAEKQLIASEQFQVQVEETANIELTSLKAWQREIFNARVVLYREFERLREVHGTTKAWQKLSAMAKYEELPEHMQKLVPLANARRGNNGRSLSKSTILGWDRKVKAHGLAGLAPKGVEKNDIPAWAPFFLKCYQKPQKPSLADAHEEMLKILPEEIPAPSYSQVYRFNKKRHAVDKEKGRHSSSSLRQFKGFIRRSDKNLLPGDIGQCDGHSFKARVAHPEHGRPFHPEVCGILDWKTRVCTGWSAWLSESSLTVAGAIVHSLQVTEAKPYGGTFAILYFDQGSGNKSHMVSDEVVGVLSRAGTQPEMGIPGNAQGRGLIERSNVSIWIRAAKKLETYTGKDMDSKKAREIYLVMDREVKKTGTCTHPALPSWDDFLRLCQQTVDDYNRRPHSSLPKIVDPNTGRKRHMAPLEMWAQHLYEGWTPSVLPQEILDDLQRPQMIRKAIRCEISMFGNKYYSKDLEGYHRHEVIVEYDIHDAREVKVRDINQRLICRAHFEKNVRDAFPITYVKKVKTDRAKRRLDLIDHKRDEILAEERGLIELPTATPALEVDKKALVIEMEAMASTPLIPTDDKGRFSFWNELDTRVTKAESLTDKEKMFYKAYQKSASYRAFKSVAEDLGQQV